MKVGEGDGDRAKCPSGRGECPGPCCGAGRGRSGLIWRSPLTDNSLTDNSRGGGRDLW